MALHPSFVVAEDSWTSLSMPSLETLVLEHEEASAKLDTWASLCVAVDDEVTMIL